MGYEWKVKFSDGRRMRQRVPVFGYGVPLLKNLEVQFCMLLVNS